MLTALEVKTSYSILSSLNRIDKLTEKASELGYFSLCITDTNNMFGVYEFYLSCRRIRRFRCTSLSLISEIKGLSSDRLFLSFSI